MKAIDLFCGAGGFRLAMRALGIECVFASEINPTAAAVYADNFGEAPAGDITAIRPADIPPCDLLTAGFPCQPFSAAGLKLGFEDRTRGTLFFDLCRIIAARRPKMLLLENVKGLVTHDAGRTLQTVLGALRALGYRAHWQVVDSARYGLPQERERFYCAAFDRDVPFAFPQPAFPTRYLRHALDPDADADPRLALSPFQRARLDYHFAHQRFPGAPVLHADWPHAPGSARARLGVFSRTLPNGRVRFFRGDGFQIQHLLFCHRDYFANTLLASASPILLHDLRRRLSAREMKRLQGFPDGFRLPDSLSAAQRLLGNAVSVPVATAIIRAMVHAYARAAPR